MRTPLLFTASLLLLAGCASNGSMPQAQSDNGLEMHVDDRPPRQTSKIDPVYPPAAREEGVTGTVTVEFVISATGTVSSARAIASPDARLSEAAVSAVLQWRFAPALKAGRPVESRMRQTIAFGLN
ncbi:MAG: energy transducer TonB [Verrucomicrobia bacterium]|nr:energy transducer TonB [Verrucomicrobiota bacterium]